MKTTFLISLLTPLLVASCSKYEKRIDAFYYPDRSNPDREVLRFGLSTVEACRDWVYAQAAQYNDPNMVRGDYECAIDPLKDQPYPGVTVYRKTVR